MRISNLVILVLLVSNVLFAFFLLRVEEPSSLPEPDAEVIEQMTRETGVSSESTSSSAKEQQDLAALEALKEENQALQKEVDDLKRELSVYNARRQRPGVSSGGTGMVYRSDPMTTLLEDESTAELALDWIRGDQSRRFASLIALSELDPVQKEKLLDLLTERYAHRSDMNQFGTDALPEEEQQAIEANYLREMHALVGEPMTELFLKAETKPLSFARIQEIDTLMRFGNEPLTQEQYLPIWNLLSNTIQVGVRMNDADSVIEFSERSIAKNLSMLSEAQGVLTPSQYAIFEERILSDVTQTRVRQHLMLQSFEKRAELEAGTPPQN